MESEGHPFRYCSGRMWAYVQLPGPEAMEPPENSDDEDYDLYYEWRVRPAFGYWKPVPWVFARTEFIDLT